MDAASSNAQVNSIQPSASAGSCISVKKLVNSVGTEEITPMTTDPVSCLGRERALHSHEDSV